MKRKYLLLMLCAAALLLSGCAMRTVEEMYALPRRSEAYSQLQSAIDSAMTGLTYCAPVSGENQQSVQMADLDGDGVEEYIVFASGNQEKPLQILIFSQQSDGTCVLSEIIGSNGSAFERVEYVSFDEKPGVELVVGRQVSNQILGSVSVYSFSGGSAEQLLMVGYSKFLTCDLDQNGRSELMVLRPGEAETKRGMAVLYGMNSGQVERSMETELSASTEQIRRIMPSMLEDGIPAVYVASSTENASIVTDILTTKNGVLTNIASSGQSETNMQTLRNFYVYAEDIDNDGVLELPSMMTMKPVGRWREGEQTYLLRWFSLDLKGRQRDKLYTFHYYMGGWYVQLDGNWASRVSVSQQNGTYTFYVWDETYEAAESLFTIYALTGSSRDEDAEKDGRFALHRAEGIAYAGKLENSAEKYGITEKVVTSSFHLIRQDWRTGEA